MGIDLQSLNMLRYAYKKFGYFNKTATIGRQNLHVNEHTLRRTLQVDSKYNHKEFSEQILTE